MIEPKAQAAVNLHAVLRDLEDLVALDEQAARLVAHADTRVTFRVRGLDPLSLTFTHGSCRAQVHPDPLPPGHREVVLGFATPQHFNALVAGKGVPVPLKGVRRLGFVQHEFTALTRRLEAVLRPAPGTEPTEQDRRLAATLSAYVAFEALAQVAGHDTLGRANAARMADGDISVEVAGGPGLTIHVADHRLTVTKGATPGARARMAFASLEDAGAVLAGELDSYAAMGDGRLAVSGYLPLLDHMNKILFLVARYLA